MSSSAGSALISTGTSEGRDEMPCAACQSTPVHIDWARLRYRPSPRYEDRKGSEEEATSIDSAILKDARVDTNEPCTNAQQRIAAHGFTVDEVSLVDLFNDTNYPCVDGALYAKVPGVVVELSYATSGSGHTRLKLILRSFTSKYENEKLGITTAEDIDRSCGETDNTLSDCWNIKDTKIDPETKRLLEGRISVVPSKHEGSIAELSELYNARPKVISLITDAERVAADAGSNFEPVSGEIEDDRITLCWIADLPPPESQGDSTQVSEDDGEHSAPSKRAGLSSLLRRIRRGGS